MKKHIGLTFLCLEIFLWSIVFFFTVSNSLGQTATPTVAEIPNLESLSKKIDEIKSANWWAIFISGGVGILGIIGTIILGLKSWDTQEKINRDKIEADKIALKQKIDADAKALLTNSLSYFDGGTQRRAVGISIIEGNWEKPEYSEFKNIWLSALITQAVYILSKSCRINDKGSLELLEEHEFLNLENILQLIYKLNDDEALKKKKGLLDGDKDELEFAFANSFEKHNKIEEHFNGSSKQNVANIEQSRKWIEWLKQTYWKDSSKS